METLKWGGRPTGHSITPHYSPLVLNTLQTESHCAAEWDIALKERWEEAENNILEKRI